MANKRKGFIDDATEVLINEIMPTAVKWLLDKVPEDRYEEIFQDKKKYWEIALPFFSFALLRTTNAPQVVDELFTRFFGELRRAINHRTGEAPTAETPKRIDAIAEIAKYPSLLKRFSSLNNKERRAILSHLAKFPPDHFQIISKMDNSDFQLYVDVVTSKEQERIWPQTKKIGEGVWESFRKWWEEGEKREEGEKKLNLSDAFRAGIDAFEAGKNSKKITSKPRNWFVRHRYLVVLLLWVLVMVVMIVIKATIK